MQLLLAQNPPQNLLNNLHLVHMAQSAGDRLGWGRSMSTMFRRRAGRGLTYHSPARRVRFEPPGGEAHESPQWDHLRDHHTHMMGHRARRAKTQRARRERGAGATHTTTTLATATTTAPPPHHHHPTTAPPPPPQPHTHPPTDVINQRRKNGSPLAPQLPSPQLSPRNYTKVVYPIPRHLRREGRKAGADSRQK